MSYNPFAYTKKIIYDLEFSGDLRKNGGIDCCIWQIAAMDYDTGETFSSFVNPYIYHEEVPLPVDNRYRMPTKEELYYNGAPGIKEAMRQLHLFFVRCSNEKQVNICLLSHNGFRSDKKVFENTLIRYNIVDIFQDMPLFFLDTLYYFRKIYPGLDSYSLANLYRYKFESEFKDAHDANVDVKILNTLLKSTKKNINGVIYSLFSIPFTNVNGIGTFTEAQLLSYHFMSLSHFVYSFKNKEDMILFLNGTVLKDRAELITNRIIDYVKSENSLRWPLLTQQQQELMQEKNAE